MAKKPKPEPDDKEQSERFVETAQELGADETGKAFDRAFSGISARKEAPKKHKKPSSRG